MNIQLVCERVEFGKFIIIIIYVYLYVYIYIYNYHKLLVWKMSNLYKNTQNSIKNLHVSITQPSFNSHKKGGHLFSCSDFALWYSLFSFIYLFIQTFCMGSQLLYKVVLVSAV